MSKPQIIIWPAASTTSVALFQTLLGPGLLTLNGTLSDGVQPFPKVSFINYSRTITLSSANNLSGVNFTIFGKVNGVEIAEIIAGPNNNTVSTIEAFDVVEAISTSAAVAVVAAGTGQAGYTRFFYVDPYIAPTQLTAQVIITGTINYSFGVTLDDVNVDPSPTFFDPIGAMTNATTNQLASTQIGALFAVITINSSTGAATLTSSIMQSGIR